MRREERELRKLAGKYGLRVEHSRKHFMLLDHLGAVVAMHSSTSSNWRAGRNLESKIRRALGK